MDKIESLRAELKAMERIAKILHELPNADAVIRVAEWVQEVTQTERYPEKTESSDPDEKDVPLYVVIEKQLESMPVSELTHLRAVIDNQIGGSEEVKCLNCVSRNIPPEGPNGLS